MKPHFDAWQMCYNASKEENYIHYNTSEPMRENDKHNFILPSDYNQEETLIKRDFLLSLSKDAYYIVSLFYDAPAELLTPLTNNITKRSILLFLRKNLGWERRKIKLAFKEVQKYAKIL